jgi:hypothetical protein
MRGVLGTLEFASDLDLDLDLVRTDGPRLTV